MKVVRGRLPSSVTTSVSSMRTPPMPARYTPGSTVTTTPGREDSSAQRADRGGLVDVEPHPVAGAVLEGLGPPGLGDDPPADVVDLLGPRPGADGGHPLGLGGAAPPRRPGPARRWARRRRRRSGSCRSGSPRRWPRSRPPPGRRRRCAGRSGWWWGLAEFGPAATMVSKAVDSAPPWRMAVSRARAKTSSVTSVRAAEASRGSTSASAASAMAAARAMRSISPWSFTSRSASTSPVVATHLGPLEQLGPAPGGGPGDAVLLQAHPATAVHRRPHRLALVGDVAHGDLDRGPRRRDLLGRLGAVAAVGGEQGPAVRHRQHPGRAGEAGQVAHVGQVGDDQARRPRPPPGRPAGGPAGRPPRAGPGGQRSSSVPPLRADRPARPAGRPPPRGPGRSRRRRSRPPSRRPPGPAPRRGGRARGPPGSRGAARPPPRRRRPGRR